MIEESPPPLLARHQKGNKKRLGTWAAIGAACLKFLSQFKFLLVFLKTGGSMLLVMWIYAMAWGWPYAAGFVVLIFIHECGHLVFARAFGLKVGAPVFIPFMGAFIALKEAPRDAWMEAWVGIGGPLFGTAGALLCAALYAATGNPLYRALAYSGFFLNLFNLTPITPLDGGRVAAAISPWLWIAGLAAIGGMLFYRFNFILLLIIVLSLPRVWRLLRGGVAAERYFEVSAARRWVMTLLYFGLAGFLWGGMTLTRFTPRSHRPIQAASIPLPG